MTGVALKGQIVQYVRIDEGQCIGCVLCMKACPTKAIRVRHKGVASIEGVCIDCGECIRICPKKAISHIPPEMECELDARTITLVSSSTVLYAQFGEDDLPNDILLALRKMGFRHVYDQAYTNEIFSTAIELYVSEKLGEYYTARRPLTRDALTEDLERPWPLISPICPVVVRLIAHRHPSLMKNIPPLITPREIVAREGKRRLSERYGYKEEDIRVLHITPCHSKVISIKEPLLQSHSYLDRTIGICDVYEQVKRHLQKVEEDDVLHYSGGIGLGWSMSGGEVRGLRMKCLAVSGLQETIRYLDKIEMGLLRDVDYVEFRICTEGCIGGPYTVADKYRAKSRLERLVRMFGIEKRVKEAYVRSLYKKGWFFEKRPAEMVFMAEAKGDVSERIQRLNEVEKILSLLPGKECGLCGCPDCRTFAEDVVNGKAGLRECFAWRQPP
jgi:iron only hydrogenase large subunit-like protein